MAKYRLTRDVSANGTAENTIKAPAGQLAPKNLYLTKQLKKGEVIEGEIATKDSYFGQKGQSIEFKMSGATTTNGVPYSDLAVLYIPIDNNGALEEIDENGNLIKNQKDVLLGEPFLQKHKNHLLIAVALVAGYFAYKKFKN